MTDNLSASQSISRCIGIEVG